MKQRKIFEARRRYEGDAVPEDEAGGALLAGRTGKCRSFAARELGGWKEIINMTEARHILRYIKRCILCVIK